MSNSEATDFDPWDVYERSPEDDAPEAPAKFSLRPAVIPGHSYERAIGDKLAEYTGSKSRYLPVERQHALARLIQDGLAAQEELEQLSPLTAHGRVSKRAENKKEKLEARIAAGRLAEQELIECNLRIATYIARLSMNLPIGTITDDENEPKRTTRPKKRHVFEEGVAFSPSDMTRFRSPFAVYDDRVQVANEYLVEAARKFKPGFRNSRGENKGKLVSFRAFAIGGLKRDLARYIMTQEKPGVYVPLHQVDNIINAERYTAEGMDVTPERYAEFKEWDKLRDVVPLDDLMSHNAANEEVAAPWEEPSVLPLGEVVADVNSVSVFDEVIDEMLGDALAEVLKTLSEREAGVIRLRYGLNKDGKKYNLDEVGLVYGVTRERIRQIEAKAMDKLRHPSRADKLRNFAHEMYGEAIDAPSHTIPYPRLKTSRSVGGGAIRLVRDIPYIAQRGAFATPRERWQAYPDEQWEEPVRKTAEELEHEFAETARAFKSLLFEVSAYHFQRSFTGTVKSPYPMVLAERIEQELGKQLTAEHITHFWEHEFIPLCERLQQEVGEDVDYDRINRLLSRLLAERTNDNTKIELHIPEALDGKLNYVGAWFRHGMLIVHGNLGAYAGYRMQGLGHIIVNGSTDNYAGSNAFGMARLEINEDARHYAAAEIHGRASMLVRGSIGHYGAYKAYQSATVVIEGSAGQRFASKAKCGTLQVLGGAASLDPSPDFAGVLEATQRLRD